jgi:hypothetical protein
MPQTNKSFAGTCCHHDFGFMRFRLSGLESLSDFPDPVRGDSLVVADKAYCAPMDAMVSSQLLWRCHLYRVDHCTADNPDVFRGMTLA